MKLSYIIFFVVMWMQLKSQQFNFGVGFTTNNGLLISESNNQNVEGYKLTTQWSPSIGLNVFTEVSSKSAFNLRFDIHANSKKIALTIVRPLKFDDINTEFITYKFSSLDTRWSASYLLPNRKRWQIAPLVGFSVGASKFSNFDYVQRVNYSPGQFLNRDINSTVRNKSVFFSTAILGGVKVKPPLLILNRQVELNIIFNYVPLPLLDFPFDLPPFQVEGKYHFVSVGMNLFLNKSEN